MKKYKEFSNVIHTFLSKPSTKDICEQFTNCFMHLYDEFPENFFNYLTESEDNILYQIYLLCDSSEINENIRAVDQNTIDEQVSYNKILDVINNYEKMGVK